jgi:hypothetical protein
MYVPNATGRYDSEGKTYAMDKALMAIARLRSMTQRSRSNQAENCWEEIRGITEGVQK